jgi:hypothetical protein
LATPDYTLNLQMPRNPQSIDDYGGVYWGSLDSLADSQMRYGQPELLFNKIGMHDVMYRQEQSATAAPAGINDNVLLNTPTEDLVEELAERYRLNVPVLDRANAEAEHSEGLLQSTLLFARLWWERWAPHGTGQHH